MLCVGLGLELVVSYPGVATQARERPAVAMVTPQTQHATC